MRLWTPPGLGVGLEAFISQWCLTLGGSVSLFIFNKVYNLNIFCFIYLFCWNISFTEMEFIVHRKKKCKTFYYRLRDL